MQDNYIGDIGDYGKYGLLREICASDMSLSVNWYKVSPEKYGNQNDGKYISYLSMPQLYREYDPDLFDCIQKVVMQDNDRRIERIEEENLFNAIYFSKVLCEDRKIWHKQALEQTKNTSVVFLDPDNGLETVKMYQSDKSTEKHVKWDELKDYYKRGQNVILYQHRPQMTSKEKCIENLLRYQKNYLLADYVKILEFPKYTNRFYFMFFHQESKSSFDRVCYSMVKKCGKNNFCREIIF